MLNIIIFSINPDEAIVAKEDIMNRNNPITRFFCLATAAMLAFSLMLASCGLKAPNYLVPSLEDLKDELKDYPGFIIPDTPYISGYPPDINFSVLQYSANREILDGYGITVWTPIPIEDFTLEGLHCSCWSLANDSDGVNQPEYQKPNAQYFGVDVFENCEDLTWNQEFRDLYDVPEGSFFYWYTYQFDFMNSKYTIFARLIRPDSISDDAGNAIAVEKGKEEMLGIIKSIIDQEETFGESLMEGIEEDRSGIADGI